MSEDASPDVRMQIESFPLLWPPSDTARGTSIEGIFLTDADLDHTLGLLLLREGPRLTIYATSPVRHALTSGLALASTLDCYCSVEWREPSTEFRELLYTDGSLSGLGYAVFPIAGKPPRYLERQATPYVGDRVGYRFVDEKTGGRLVFLPGLVSLDETVKAHSRNCDALLLDGTFWSEQEMHVGRTSATQMSHLPVGGSHGSLQQIAPLSISHKVYMHINNTNPMLVEDSPEHAAVKAVGVDIGWDGLELAL